MSAAFAFVHAPVMLGDQQQVMTGSLQVGSVLVGGQTFGRMELGNLIANGISPAQQGWRINDGSGNPLADSQGLIGVATVLVNTTASTQTLSPAFGGLTFATVAWGVNTFTVSRTVNVLALAAFTGAASLSAGTQVAFAAQLGIDSGSVPEASSNFQEWDALSAAVQPNTNGLCLELKSVTKGTHTINAYVNATGSGGPAGSWILEGGQLFVFQLGG